MQETAIKAHLPPKDIKLPFEKWRKKKTGRAVLQCFITLVVTRMQVSAIEPDEYISWFYWPILVYHL